MYCCYLWLLILRIFSWKNDVFTISAKNMLKIERTSYGLRKRVSEHILDYCSVDYRSSSAYGHGTGRDVPGTAVFHNGNIELDDQIMSDSDFMSLKKRYMNFIQSFWTKKKLIISTNLISIVHCVRMMKISKISSAKLDSNHAWFLFKNQKINFYNSFDNFFFKPLAISINVKNQSKIWSLKIINRYNRLFSTISF